MAFKDYYFHYFVCVYSLFYSCSGIHSKLKDGFQEELYYDGYSKNDIYYRIEKTNNKTDEQGNEMCVNYTIMNYSDSIIILRGMTLKQLLNAFYQLPERNIKIDIGKNPQCFFNMQIKSSTKGLIDKKYLIVDDLQQIFDIRLKDSIFYGYSKKLVIKDYDKLLKYRYIPFGKPSKIKISNRNIFFDNCTINNIADYLQGFYNERIICNEKDTNRYSFSISNDILKLNRDLNIVGLNFDSVYSSDTLYIFYSIKGI